LAKAEEPYQIFVLSGGFTTCGEYTADQSNQFALLGWVLGYITGANAHGRAGERMTGSPPKACATA
jgi:hypothetical protein